MRIVLIIVIAAIAIVCSPDIVEVRVPAWRSVTFADSAHGWVSGGRGLYYSATSGQRWEKRGEWPGLYKSTGLFVRQNAGEIVWASASTAVVRTDTGITRCQSGVAACLNQLIQPDPLLDSRQIKFGSEREGWLLTGPAMPNSIYRTEDGGRTWKKQMETGRRLLCIFALSPQSVRAAGEGGVLFRSDDGGNTWQQQSVATQGSLAAILFLNSAIGWVTDNVALYQTTDGGATWTKHPLPKGSAFNGFSFTSEKDGWVVGARYKATSLAMHTEDGGLNWKLVDTGSQDVFLSIQAVSPSEVWLAGASGTVLHTVNRGESWERVALP